MQTAPGRARIALTLHSRTDDRVHRDTIMRIAEVFGLPVVATGNVCMHLRSRKPVQDVMTAIQHSMPVTKCGYRIPSNAEQFCRQTDSGVNLTQYS